MKLKKIIISIFNIVQTVVNHIMKVWFASQGQRHKRILLLLAVEVDFWGLDIIL